MQQLRMAAANLKQKPSRQSIAASVLGPSHNLPTRTVEQQVCLALSMMGCMRLS